MKTVKDELARIERNTDESDSSILGRVRTVVQAADAYVKAQFDGTNTQGFAFRIGEQVQQIASGIDEKVGRTIEERLRMEMGEALKPITEGLTAVRELLAKEAGRAAGGVVRQPYNAANPRQLEAIPSPKDNLASQMEELPRSNAANAEGKSGLPSSRQRPAPSRPRKTRQSLRITQGNAAS